MKKSFWSRAPRSSAILFAGLVLATSTLHASELKHYCYQQRQIRPLRVLLTGKLPRPTSGAPLDQALEKEHAALESLREEARSYFFIHRHDQFKGLIVRYTFLFPESIKDRYGLGTMIYNDISSALKYRELLWRDYIEKFTTVKEAPSGDPRTLKFEVSLDLSLYCQYGQATRNLVSRSE
jgi:hypothetical protein